MKKRPDIFNLIQEHIQEHKLDSTPETMFIEFQHILNVHLEFKNHLKDYPMQRNAQKLDKRKIFMEWYVQKYQNSKSIKEMWLDLSEFLFVSDRTVRKDLFTETTD